MKMLLLRFTLVMTLVSMVTSMQSQTATAQQFEIASIKPSLRQLPVGNIGSIMTFPGRLHADAALLSVVIQDAYQIRKYQLVGGPDGINSSRYEIEAKAVDGNTTFDQLWQMLQSLLEERFQLKAHHETRQLPAYQLTMAKSGSRLQKPREGSCVPLPLNGPPIPPPPPPPGGVLPPPPCGRVYMGLFDGKASLTGRQASMAEFVRVLTNVLGRPVINKTDLQGVFDIDLPFAPDASLEGLPGVGTPGGPVLPVAADPTLGTTIFTAIQEQLGLKLESARAPVEVLVIDSIQPLSEN